MLFLVNDSPFAGREGALRHLAQPARAAVHRGADERLHARGGDGQHRYLPRQRPRRAAPVHPHRADAAAGVRVRRLPAEGHPAPRRAGPHDRAHRGADRGRAAGVRGRGDRKARAAQGRHARHAAPGRGERAAALPHPRARADGLPLRAADRHARQRRDEPPVLRLRAVQGRDRGAAHRQPRRPRDGRDDQLRPVQQRRSAAACSSARACPCTRGRSWASARAARTSSSTCARKST